MLWVAAMLCLLALEFAGYANAKAKLQFREEVLSQLFDGQATRIVGEIYKIEEKTSSTQYYLKHSYIEINGKFHPCNHILVYLKEENPKIGQTVLVSGTVRFFEEPTNEGQFNQKAFYQSQKIDFSFSGEEVKTANNPLPLHARILQKLTRMREQLRSIYETIANKEDAGIYCTMILGDRSLMQQEIKEIYQDGGISHILAISGLHISMIGMFLYKAVRKAGCGFFPAMMVSFPILCFYAWMTGMGVSTFRAVLMFFLALMAPTLKRSYDSLSALSVAATLLLLQNPFCIFYSGFQYSFLAVLGVVFVGKTISLSFAKKSAWKQTFAVSFSIQMMTIPITLWNYYEFPPYAMFVNMAILPLVSIVLAGGILGGILGLFSLRLGKIVLFPSHLILLFYKKVAAASVTLPGGMLITGKPQFWQLLVYYMMLLLLTLYCANRKENSPCNEKRKLLQDRGKTLLLDEKKTSMRDIEKVSLCDMEKIPLQDKEKLFLQIMQKIAVHMKKIFLCKKSLQFILPLGMFSLLCLCSGRRDAEVDFLDVGQGDGIYVATKDGTRMFIDGGSTSQKQVGTYVLAPFLKCVGCRKLDYVFLSHLDEDHCSGMLELLDADFSIDMVFLSGAMEEDEIKDKLTALLDSEGIAWDTLWEGDSLRMETATVSCLYPSKGITVTEQNASSLVLEYEENGIRFLFAGDITKEEEAILCNRELLRQMDIYKCAHHGSKYSSSEELLNEISPKATVISCAKKNQYGHPAKETIERLTKAKSRIFYTMHEGQIKVDMPLYKVANIYPFVL